MSLRLFLARSDAFSAEFFEQFGEFQGSLTGAGAGGLVAFFGKSGGVGGERFHLFVDLSHQFFHFFVCLMGL